MRIVDLVQMTNLLRVRLSEKAQKMEQKETHWQILVKWNRMDDLVYLSLTVNKKK